LDDGERQAVKNVYRKLKLFPISGVSNAFSRVLGELNTYFGKEDDVDDIQFIFGAQSWVKHATTVAANKSRDKHALGMVRQALFLRYNGTVGAQSVDPEEDIARMQGVLKSWTTGKYAELIKSSQLIRQQLDDINSGAHKPFNSEPNQDEDVQLFADPAATFEKEVSETSEETQEQKKKLAEFTEEQRVAYEKEQLAMELERKDTVATPKAKELSEAELVQKEEIRQKLMKAATDWDKEYIYGTYASMGRFITALEDGSINMASMHHLLLNGKDPFVEIMKDLDVLKMIKFIGKDYDLKHKDVDVFTPRLALLITLYVHSGGDEKRSWKSAHRYYMRRVSKIAFDYLGGSPLERDTKAAQETLEEYVKYEALGPKVVTKMLSQGASPLDFRRALGVSRRKELLLEERKAERERVEKHVAEVETSLNDLLQNPDGSSEPAKVTAKKQDESVQNTDNKASDVPPVV